MPCGWETISWKGSVVRAPAARPGSPCIASLAILVAEDDPAILATLAAFLREEGHRVLLAHNGDEAVSVLRYEPVDLVLTDVLMPRKDGLEFIQEMHQRWPKLPIIAMSGGSRRLADDYCLKVAKSFGARVVIAKPFSGDQILAAIGAAIAPADGA